MTAELVLDCRALIGESLLWVPEEGRLYWADIKAPSLNALHLATGETKRWRVTSEIGGFALDGAQHALVALRHGLFWLDLTTGSAELTVPSPYDPALIRFNESGCDSSGRFWIGAMTDPVDGTPTGKTGALYSYTGAAGLRAYPDFAHITNGMAWSADEANFFISHSEERVIYNYPYDIAQGKLGPRFIFVRHTGEGIPDGAAIDRLGNYWCAMHGAACLHRYAPDGALAEVVHLPVSKPTMCCFAGDGLKDLYISSARDGLDAATLAREPLAGGLFRLTPEISGLPRHWRVAR